MSSGAAVREHYDGVAAEYDRTTARSHHYHEALRTSLRQVIPAGRRVLEVGSATGDMLASVQPSYGVGVDLSPAMVERATEKHSHLTFLAADILDQPLSETFEFVISVNLMEHVVDVLGATRAMAAMLEPGGTMLVITPHPVWAFPYWLAERFDLKVPEGWHRWRSRGDLLRAGEAAGLSLRFFDRDFIIPRRIPGLEQLNRASWARPLRARLGMIQRAVFEKPGG